MKTQSKKYPALRVENEPDSLDAERVSYVRDRWSSQDNHLIPYARTVEEHCRMLAGRQWDIWSDTLGRFIDISSLFSDREKAWKERPVVNMLLYWYMLTHARMTENPPIITFQPAKADRLDAQLAQTMDVVFKTLWNQLHAPEAVDQAIAWLIVAGQSFIKSYPDDSKGEQRERVGDASFEMTDPETGEPYMADAESPVPLDEYGNPLAELMQGEDGEHFIEPTTEPESFIQPDLAICALNPLQVRGEWNKKKWNDKLWHIHFDYFSPDHVLEKWGIEVKANTSITNGSSNGPGYLENLLFGSGDYGAITGSIGSTPTSQELLGELVGVWEMWEAPCMQNEMQGRLTVVTENEVLYDGPRPFPNLSGTSPIQRIQFVGLPNRDQGTSPMEMLVPLQRVYNRGTAQALEHRSLSTNPMILVDGSANIDPDQFVSEPGSVIENGLLNGSPTIAAFQPPNLSSDFWRIQDWIYQTFLFLGNISGAEGKAPTANASGELVEQLRNNSDRFIGPTMRNLVMALSRVAEDWVAILGVLWDQPKLIVYAGEDSVPQTLAIEPKIWEGMIHAVPDVESMLPEGKGEKQAKVFQLWQAGFYGDPIDPATIAKVAPMMRFPHMSRTAMPGGIDAITANHNLGKLLLGAQPEEIPLFDAYNPQQHLDVVNTYIAGSEFLSNDQDIQQSILTFVDILKQFAVAQAARKAEEAAILQMAVMNATARIMPPPPPTDPNQEQQQSASSAGVRKPSPSETSAKPQSVSPAPQRAAPELS